MIPVVPSAVVFMMAIAMSVIAVVVIAIMPAIVITTIMFVVAVSVPLRDGHRRRECQPQQSRRAGPEPQLQ
jgi:hypothetical protein